MSEKLEKMLFEVNKPYQYAGGEYLSSGKSFENSDVKFVLAFPDGYEIGISNLGLKVLYGAINSHEGFYADRSCAPDFDFKEILEREKMLLYGLESKKPLKEFDFVGVSLQYELAYPTVLKMLSLGGISVKRDDRDENEPIIIAGGPCCYNPAPMSEFIDLFLIGDGEDLIVELAEKYKTLQGLSRKEKIRKLAEIEGVYAPSVNNSVKKRIAELKYHNIPITSPVPYSTCVHDRSIIEIRRGCGRMCRFCQPGHVNLPIRERKAEDIIKAVKLSTEKTGYDEYSLLSLSSNDYTNIEPVIEELNAELCERRVSVSLPSQRIDRYSERLATLVRGIRKAAVTLAPEAGSQKLRNVINKNLTEEQIFETVLNCYKSGSDSIKLYFIAGLPTETDDDIRETAELLRRIRYRATGIKNELGLKNPLRLTCTMSIFVPKPFTPFQRHGQDSRARIREKLSLLLDLTSKIKNVKINYHNPFVSMLEAAFTRGDKRFSQLIYKLYEKNVYLSSDDKNLDFSLWEETAKECGIDFEKEATRFYGKDEDLPWGMIDTGIRKEWFDAEYEKALRAEATLPCEFNCVNCGVCGHFKVKPVRDGKYIAKAIQPDKKPEDEEKYKYRLQLTKENELRYLSHLDWQNTLIKSLYRSGLKLCFSRGFNPTPKISLGTALPVFLESLTEFVDIEIREKLPEEEVKAELSKVLPKNIRLLAVKEIPVNSTAFDRLAYTAEYEFYPLEKGLYDYDNLLYILNKRFFNREEILTEKKNKKGIINTINIKPSIMSIKADKEKLTMVLKTGQSTDIPALRADLAAKVLVPEIQFRIIRTKFFDERGKELTPEGF